MTSNIAAPHLEGRPRLTGPSPDGAPAMTGRGKAERVAIIGLFSLGVLYTLYLARDLLLPIFLALLLSLLLRPVVKGLRRLRIPEALSAAFLVVVLLVGLVGAAFSLSEPATVWIKRAPVVMHQLEFKLGDLRESVESARRASHQIEQMAAAADDEAQAVVVRGPSLAEQALTQTQVILAQLFIVLVLLFFFLARGRNMLEQLMGTLTNLEDRIHYATIASTVQKNIAAYLATVTLINTALGLVTTGLMMALRHAEPRPLGRYGRLFELHSLSGSGCQPDDHRSRLGPDLRQPASDSIAAHGLSGRDHDRGKLPHPPDRRPPADAEPDRRLPDHPVLGLAMGHSRSADGGADPGGVQDPVRRPQTTPPARRSAGWIGVEGPTPYSSTPFSR